ncbi:MAG: hypothetical protein J6X32_03145 [Salinivirgaceae bacterium]|nr:hypothetical protein [Salinivirgaceae bacterium]
MTFGYNKKTIVVYDDHRWILNVLNSLKNECALNNKEWKSHNIIYFDYHDDACNPVKFDLRKIKKFLNGNISIRDFYEIVEFELNPYDDDWVTAGMEFELIKDVVCIGSKSEERHIVRWKNNTYKTRLKKEHKGFCINHLKYELTDNGAINGNNDVRNIFGYKGLNTDLTPNNPYVLDFDLDCFTEAYKKRDIAWSQKKFLEEYVNNDDTFHFMQQLIANASIITICREPECCGGIGESNKILGYLDRYFFDGALRMEPTR